MPELARLTWKEAEQAIDKAKLALVPVGSLEQHGPHLSLDTDMAVAQALADRLQSDLGHDAVLCPPVTYGLSEHHMAFPGTMTLRPNTLVALFHDLVESLASWDLRRVLVINGHGGNIDALRLASRNARRDHRSLVAAIMWAVLAAPEIAARTQSPQYGHACEIETSVAMDLIPDRVRLDLISRPGQRRSADPLTDPPRNLVDQAVWMEEWTDDGALGDPSLASAEMGKDLMEVIYERALAFARRFSQRELPKDGA
ncbi:MAG: creatininase family protein [Acidimicrobiia bacterium]